MLWRPLKPRLDRLVMASFDRWSENYRNDVVLKLRQRGYSYEELGSLVVTKLKLTSGCAVLELGIGSGVLAEQITAIFDVRLFGIDISRNMLKITQKMLKRVMLCQCNAEVLPFPNDSIDRLYSTFMLHSVMDQEKALLEMKRVLKPLGRGVIVDLCIKQSRIPYWSAIRSNFHSLRYEHGAPSKYRSVNEYENMLNSCGFEVLGIQCLGIQKGYTHFLFAFRK